jgi:hypothetical protein
MWRHLQAALRSVVILSLGIGSLLALIDQWITPIPVAWIGGAVAFYLGVGSGAWAFWEHRRETTPAES